MLIISKVSLANRGDIFILLSSFGSSHHTFSFGKKYFVLKPSTSVFVVPCVGKQRQSFTWTPRNSFRPYKCLRERLNDDILYYPLNIRLLKSVAVSGRRERFCLMPISAYAFQKWVYSVADNAVCPTTASTSSPSKVGLVIVFPEVGAENIILFVCCNRISTVWVVDSMKQENYICSS